MCGIDLLKFNALDELPETVLIELILGLDDESLIIFCEEPISKKITNACYKNGNIRDKYDYLIFGKIDKAHDISDGDTDYFEVHAPIDFTQYTFANKFLSQYAIYAPDKFRQRLNIPLEKYYKYLKNTQIRAPKEDASELEKSDFMSIMENLLNDKMSKFQAIFLVEAYTNKRI